MKNAQARAKRWQFANMHIENQSFKALPSTRWRLHMNERIESGKTRGADMRASQYHKDTKFPKRLDPEKAGMVLDAQLSWHNE